ncbi:unnamed protein product [Ceratitis capitata]|uniref:(Mediterranean fruit fly) hypothetical protein n=1 Tax=Ceratitis capitata TaxID=7213 RepID=A0A811UKL6_CERCA|nr:unnamed protein product [Ceratitis capitata]
MRKIYLKREGIEKRFRRIRVHLIAFRPYAGKSTKYADNKGVTQQRIKRSHKLKLWKSRKEFCLGQILFDWKSSSTCSVATRTCQDALKHETFPFPDIKRALKGFDSGIDGGEVRKGPSPRSCDILPAGKLPPESDAASPRGMQPCSPSGVIAVMPPSKSPTMETAAGQQANVHVGSDENACEKEQQQRAATPIGTAPTTNTNTTATTTHLTNARACPLKFSIAKIWSPINAPAVNAYRRDECESERAELHYPPRLVVNNNAPAPTLTTMTLRSKNMCPSASANTAAAVTAAAVAANTVTNVAAVQQFLMCAAAAAQYAALTAAQQQTLLANPGAAAHLSSFTASLNSFHTQSLRRNLSASGHHLAAAAAAAAAAQVQAQHAHHQALASAHPQLQQSLEKQQQHQQQQHHKIRDGAAYLA